MGNSNSGGHNKKSVAELKRDGTFREDRHGSFVDAQHNQLQHPGVGIDREDLFRQWCNRIHAAGLGQEQDAIIADQLTELTVAYNFARLKFSQDADAKIGQKLALTVMMETGKEIRMIMNDYRMMPASRNPTVDERKDDLDNLIEGVV